MARAEAADQVRVALRVVPNASRDALAGYSDEVVRIKLRAAARDGKANAALIAFVAGVCGCARRDIRLISGEHCRDKVIGLGRECALKLLAAAAAAQQDG